MKIRGQKAAVVAGDATDGKMDHTRMDTGEAGGAADEYQGCPASRYRFGGSWIGTNFWLCIWLGDPHFGYRPCKRYYFLILKMHLVVL